MFVRAPCFLPARKLGRTLRVTTLKNISIQLVLPGHSSAHATGVTARSFVSRVMGTNIGICFCGPKFLRSGLVITSSRLAYVNSTGVSFHDFRRGFRVGTFICRPSFTRRVEGMFLRSVRDYRELIPSH